jgi:ATP-dependent DNA ligase
MFWYPEKPSRIYSLKSAPDDYIMQVKKDGWRIIISTIDNEFRIYNREGRQISCTDADKWKWVSDIFGNDMKGFYLDGEVIGRRQGEAIDTIVVWDMLYWDNTPLHSLPYIERYKMLSKFIEPNVIPACIKAFGTDFIADNKGLTILLSKNYNKSDFASVWSEIERNNKYNEGVVFKNPNSSLKWSLRSTQHTINQLKLKIRD